MLFAARFSLKRYDAPFFGYGRRYFSAASSGRLHVDLSLYLITHRACAKDDTVFVDKVMQAVKGGVTCVQIRDQDEDLRASLRTAITLKEKLRPYGVRLIMNDRVDVALAALADGVHLGQKDLPYAAARRLLGSRALIGLTVDTWEDVLEAQHLDVDYLGVQVFASKQTKPGCIQPWEIEGLKKIRSISSHRIVALGGMSEGNVGMVRTILKEGDGIGMVGELWRGGDPYRVAQRVTALFRGSHVS